MNSLWLDSITNFNSANKIDNDYTSTVCVIGAGICGLSIAYSLIKNGLNVIVVDKDNIGQKTSGNTTAKITLQHNLIYDYLINSFGFDFALKYFEANKKAIFNIQKIIEFERIDCDFEKQSNFVYTTQQDDLSKINNEIKAINSFENNFAHFVDNCGLPFKICGAIRIDNQAQFNPVKYMFGLANSIQKYGGHIFTNSLVYDVKKIDDYYEVLVNNFHIKSKYVVMASHYPFINFPGFYFSKMYQSTSYALAVDTNCDLFDGMYINPSEPTFSFRTALYNKKKVLIITGGDHKTGYAPDNDKTGYKILENKVKELYPNSKILFKWNTRDCISLDKIPYIGDFSNFMPNLFVATGFNKWGMTSSNIAANIIKDKILEIDNKYADVFDSTRFGPIKNIVELKNMFSQVAKSFTINRLKIPNEALSAIKNDNGGIIKIDGTSVGIYKDKDGKIFAVNPTCTHIGCLLTWNNIDKTWDCPCHGSRFDFTGKNIYDPAFKNLEKYNI